MKFFADAKMKFAMSNGVVCDNNTEAESNIGLESVEMELTLISVIALFQMTLSNKNSMDGSIDESVFLKFVSWCQVVHKSNAISDRQPFCNQHESQVRKGTR